MKSVIGLMLGMALACTAVAAPKGEAPMNVKKSFAQQLSTIRQQLDDGKTYSELGTEDRGKVEAALSRMATVLNAHPDVDTLREEEKVVLFNDQETVNALLTKASADSRLICRREAVTGSLRTTTQCKTVAERRRDNEDAQELMRRNPTGKYD
ncbi:hypothetical protein QSH18_06390 [Xanthomonas sp. NCPPB 2654]|uniref:hypothetical protein n=1 Tax=unclassified Xanthomonas TaxID=2643310 RepID=UPI0021DF6BD7|nr:MULTISPECIES: hypothetical protein [unclassified Xanthomonas]MDL5365228.1 hypothetical protein [Xanthomonas sp. NCPPB 2654]UYC19707.1 hypothetical protein NUG20_16255 [Xanthomonas sp. CFBP 8443]